MHVTIKDFQKIESVEFTIDDIVVIFGRSAHGKSSIFRAISAAVSGRKSSSGLRYGASSTKVILEDDHIFSWIKDSNHTRFLFDKESIGKTKGVPPDDYVKALNMNCINLSDNKLNPHLLRGRDSLYVLGDSSTEIAMTLAFLFGNEKFPELLKEISKSILDRKKDIVYIEGQINLNDKLIKHEKQKVEVLENVTQYFDYINSLESASRITKEINDFCMEFDIISCDIENLTGDLNQQVGLYDSIKVKETGSPELIKDLERDLNEFDSLSLDLLNLSKELQGYDRQRSIKMHPDLLSEIKEINICLQEFREFEADIFVLEGELKTYDHYMSSIDLELSKIQFDLKDCPTCGVGFNDKTLKTFLSHMKKG